jgi:hypothetical protein
MPFPVAIFTYKRPTHTKATLDALNANTLAPQTDLYVFSDGPKREEDASAVEEVRRLTREIKGFASVTTIERATNLGLAKSIITGVSELLRKFDAIIVLEDDVVTNRHFLSYMNEALDRYRDDTLVFSVTGHTFPKETLKIPASYPYDTYAAYRCSSWSWGTWRDRWTRIDWDMKYFEDFYADEKAQEKLNRGGQDMVEMLHMQYRGHIDSWAIRFCHAHSASDMRCIYPVKTLVRNIGLDNSGTHSTYDPRFFHLELDSGWRPVKFLPKAIPDPELMARFRAIWDEPSGKDICQFCSTLKNRLFDAFKWLKDFRREKK